MLYSECDFAAKFWGPMIEKVFKDSDVITQWYVDSLHIILYACLAYCFDFI